ncbi:MAG: PD-(D/E)XK nuclease family protein [Clostridia bacterium]|nr:PD-(D/E)XK nuclease family protein [Clostridia bacterium]
MGLEKEQSTKKVDIVVSNTYLSAFYEIIDRIKCRSENNKFENIILVVPDKFSLNAEQIFMEKMETKSVFNVWLTTISRLVSKIVEEKDKNLKVLSKNSGTMLVSKIILENADKLVSYKKISNNYSLAETMFNVINLLKSSGVRPEELKNNFDNSTFGLKLQDIYIVYSQYEKQLSGMADSITRLEIFNNLAKQSEYLKNSHIYFAMFDSFTNVQINSLANLAKLCKSFCIGLCANTKQNNANIYDNVTFQKIKSTFEDEYIDFSISNIYAKHNKRNQFLSQNLLAYKVQEKFETEDIKILECDSIEQEVKYVAGKIKYLVMEKGYSFDDINVAINGLDDYAGQIQNTFIEYDLPFYLDTSRTMLDHYFCNLLFAVCDFVCGEQTLSNALSIVKSPMFLIDYSKKCDFENYCKKYNIFGNLFYSQFLQDDEMSKNAEEVRSQVFENIKNFETELKSANTTKDYTDALIGYVEAINSKETIEHNIELQTDIISKKVDQQVLEKFFKAIDEILDLVADDQVPKEMYFDMLKSGLKGVNLLTAPIRCNSVFVGDASQSTYYPRKVLFVLGSTDARMPAYQSDAGTITDTEIAIFKSSNQITPSIKELNKREKFKLFNLLLIPEDKLELCYSTMINDRVQQKSEFLNSLQSIITTNGLPLPVDRYAMEELKIFESGNKNLSAYLVGTEKNCIKLANKKTPLNIVLEDTINDILKFAEQKYRDESERFTLTETSKYLFYNQRTSISQIEKYFSCPFYQFAEKAISPKDSEDSEIKPMTIGNILHKIAQYFVDALISADFKIDDIEKLVSKCFEKTLKEQEFKSFANNTYFVYLLKDESQRFCKAIYHQIMSSDFRPLKTEMRFDFNIKNGLSLTGFVDRVDQFNDYVSIIDYKTGSQKFNFEEIYFGIKLQLIAYSKIISQILKKQTANCAYMPVKNKFYDLGDSEFKSYKLDGICLDDGVKVHLDKNLLSQSKSEIIDISQNHCLSNKELKDIFDYSFAVIDKAIDEIMSGYIVPKPYSSAQKNSCKYCKYKSVCHHLIERDGFRKIDKKNKTSFGSIDE